MNEGAAYGPAIGADSGIAELARLADELIDEIGAARRHYDDLRAVLDGQVPAAADEEGAPQARAGDRESYAEAPAAVALAEPSADDEDPNAEADGDAPPPVEGAQLVALNLALMGVERDDARTKLCDGFEIE